MPPEPEGEFRRVHLGKNRSWSRFAPETVISKENEKRRLNKAFSRLCLPQKTWRMGKQAIPPWPLSPGFSGEKSAPVAAVPATGHDWNSRASPPVRSQRPLGKSLRSPGDFLTESAFSNACACGKIQVGGHAACNASEFPGGRRNGNAFLLKGSTPVQPVA